jgi:hypothetical protein
MSSCVKPLRPKKKKRVKTSIPNHMLFIHSFLDHFSFHLCFFLKLNPKSQIAINEHRHKFFLFFMTFSQVEK